MMLVYGVAAAINNIVGGRITDWLGPDKAVMIPAEYEYEPGYYVFFFSDPDDLKFEVVQVDVQGSTEYWRRSSQSQEPLSLQRDKGLRFNAI